MSKKFIFLCYALFICAAQAQDRQGILNKINELLTNTKSVKLIASEYIAAHNEYVNAQKQSVKAVCEELVAAGKKCPDVPEHTLIFKALLCLEHKNNDSATYLKQYKDFKWCVEKALHPYMLAISILEPFVTFLDELEEKYNAALADSNLSAEVFEPIINKFFTHENVEVTDPTIVKKVEVLQTVIQKFVQTLTSCKANCPYSPLTLQTFQLPGIKECLLYSFENYPYSIRIRQ